MFEELKERIKKNKVALEAASKVIEDSDYIQNLEIILMANARECAAWELFEEGITEDNYLKIDPPIPSPISRRANPKPNRVIIGIFVYDVYESGPDIMTIDDENHHHSCSYEELVKIINQQQ